MIASSSTTSSTGAVWACAKAPDEQLIKAAVTAQRILFLTTIFAPKSKRINIEKNNIQSIIIKTNKNNICNYK
jgi:hypothetical protein